MSAETEKYVVVTTDNDKRGVFGGRLVSGEVGGVVVLADARMAVYWDTSVHGVVGLAGNGPTAKCRISPPAPTIELDGVTAIMTMTSEAKTAWAKEPWG